MLKSENLRLVLALMIFELPLFANWEAAFAHLSKHPLTNEGREVCQRLKLRKNYEGQRTLGNLCAVANEAKQKLASKNQNLPQKVLERWAYHRYVTGCPYEGEFLKQVLSNQYNENLKYWPKFVARFGTGANDFERTLSGTYQVLDKKPAYIELQLTEFFKKGN